MTATLGVMVGGRSSRMGSPKGLLRHPTEPVTLVEYAVSLGRDAGLAVVLVGEARAYREVVPSVEAVDDAPTGIGPLGGMRALMARAGRGAVLTLACDMPFVTRDTVRRLAAHPSAAAALCARRRDDAPWEPFCARYDVARAAPALDAALAAGERSLQRWLARMPVDVFDVDPRELDDWDTPDDVRRAASKWRAGPCS